MPEVDSILVSSRLVSGAIPKLGKPIQLKGSKKDLPKFLSLDGYNLLEVKSRGKELVFVFTQEGLQNLYIFFTFGLTGILLFSKKEKKTEHETCRIEFENFDISFSDQRRFGKWRISNELNWREKSPCVLTEHGKFIEHIYENLNKGNLKFKRKPLYEILMDQEYFNGIGNYLRAEILGKLDVDPYQTLEDLYKSNQNLFISFLSLCYEIPFQGFLLRASKISTDAVKKLKEIYQIEDKDFNQWQEFYRNGNKCIGFGDKSGRTFWCSRKYYRPNIEN